MQYHYRSNITDKVTLLEFYAESTVSTSLFTLILYKIVINIKYNVVCIKKIRGSYLKLKSLKVLISLKNTQQF